MSFFLLRAVSGQKQNSSGPESGDLAYFPRDTKEWNKIFGNFEILIGNVSQISGRYFRFLEELFYTHGIVLLKQRLLELLAPVYSKDNLSFEERF